MSGDDDAKLFSTSIMLRLRSEAKRAPDGRRLATLARLEEACDELQSGSAYKRARAAGRNPEFFHPDLLRLNSRTIELYVRLRASLDGSGTSWTGPVATTIRSDKDLLDYIRTREAETNRDKRPRLRTAGRRSVEDIVDKLSITEQAVIRQALADGRSWKRELDILLAALRRIPGIDLTALQSGDFSKSSSPSSGLSSDEVRIIRNLYTRLSDNGKLQEFGLLYRNKRVKMTAIPGSDLIYPEETSLLAKLAGVNQ